MKKKNEKIYIYIYILIYTKKFNSSLFFFKKKKEIILFFDFHLILIYCILLYI